MAPDAEKPYPARKLLSTGRLGTPDRELRGALQLALYIALYARMTDHIALFVVYGG